MMPLPATPRCGRSGLGFPRLHDRRVRPGDHLDHFPFHRDLEVQSDRACFSGKPPRAARDSTSPRLPAERRASAALCSSSRCANCRRPAGRLQAGDGGSLRTIDVRPHRGGWQVFEAPGVEPFYIGPNAKAFATDYAVGRGPRSQPRRRGRAGDSAEYRSLRRRNRADANGGILNHAGRNQASRNFAAGHSAPR